MRLRNQLRSLRTFERQGEALPTPVFPELLLSNYIRSICEARRVGPERGRRRHPKQFAYSSVWSARSVRSVFFSVVSGPGGEVPMLRIFALMSSDLVAVDDTLYGRSKIGPVDIREFT